MRRLWAAVLPTVLAALACRAGESASKQPPAAGEGATMLRRRLFGEPGTLNAVLQTDVTEQQVLQYVSRNLFDFDSRLELVGGLAERMDVSPDGLTYTVHLRPEAIWEDGRPVSSEDAVGTIRRIADPETPSPLFQSLFEGLISVEAEGPRAFRVRFRDAYAYRRMAFVIPLLPAHRFADRPFAQNPDNRAPLSNGPYRLASWKSQESIVLERNRRYWAAAGQFDRILFRILPENPVGYRALVRGELDETWIDAELKRKAKSDPAFAACCRVLEFYDLDYSYVALDVRLPFFSDARVRRALTMLLDRDGLARTLFEGSARVISGPWAPESPAYDAAVRPLPFDPAGAAALLEEAGWRDTNGNGTRDKGGREFDFELLVASGNTIGRQIDETFAASLARAGVRARIRPLEWAVLVERLDQGSFEAASIAWSAADPNPDPYPYWHSSQWPPRGFNSGYYRNPEADRLMDEARASLDDARRLALYHRLHRLFRDDAPAVFVVNATKKYGISKRLQDVTTSPLGLYAIWPGPLAWKAGPAPVTP